MSKTKPVRNILVVDRNLPQQFQRYTKDTSHSIDKIIGVQSLLPNQILTESLRGIELYKIELYANARLDPDVFSLVLSRLRDTKDEPSGISN
jgi:hypothetical protein